MMTEELKPQKRLLTILEFADEYGPSRSNVYKMISSGELKAVKHGKSTYIEREAAEAWLDTLPDYLDVKARSPGRCRRSQP